MKRDAIYFQCSKTRTEMFQLNDVHHTPTTTPNSNLPAYQPPSSHDKSFPSKPVTPTNFEEILYAIKSNGAWQYMILFCAATSTFFSSIIGYAQGIFLIGNMDYECLEYADGTFALESDQSNVSSNAASACSSPRTGSACIAWNYSSPYYTQTMLSEWNLVCSQSYKRSVYQSIFLLGFLIGLPIFGSISDFFGRRTVILIAWPLTIVGYLGTALAPAFWVAACMRALHGAVSGGQFKAKFVLIMEITAPEQRNFMSTMLSGCFPVAGVVVACMGYFLRDWRRFQLYGIIPALCAFPFILFLPESPRWLITHQKFEKAHQILANAASWNRAQLPKELNLNVLQGNSIGDQKEQHLSVRQRLRSLVATPAIRRRTLILFIQWFVIGLVYYGMTFYGTGVMPGDPYLTLGITSIMRFVSIPLQIWSLNKFGSRNILIAWLTVTAVLLGVLGVLPAYGLTDTQQTVSMSLVVAGTVFIDCCFMCIYIITGELYPTISRQLGLSVCSMLARVGAGVSPFIANMLGDVWKPLPAIIFSVLCFIAAVFAIMLPAAGSVLLPDTVQDVTTTKVSPTNSEENGPNHTVKEESVGKKRSKQ